MEVTEHVRIDVTDPSGTGHARRSAARLASRLELGQECEGRLAIVVTELATNLVKHGKGGELLLRALRAGERRGVGILSLDHGPGLANPARALRDGYSSAGSPGTGLGAIQRQATVFDLHSAPGAGMAVLAEIWEGGVAATPTIVAGGINVPLAGEPVSGDAWTVAEDGPRTLVLVADGVGHGVLAARAAEAAVAAFEADSSAQPGPLIERIHEALRSTRGAAVAVAEIDRTRGIVRFAGVGNISASIHHEGSSRSLVSHHGTAGHQVRRIQQFEVPWPAGALLILHSDGLVSHWALDRYPGIAARHPALTAGLLYRDFRRGRDDVSVVALREAS
jgi:anti-sigma regulatory factor (Ser/Thr protein kinase)